MGGETFLRNQWYVAAMSDEIADKPLARVICNEPVVVYRGKSGAVHTLTNRCPHRKAPLSIGDIHGDDLACGYHGIRFGGNGDCTHVPGGAPIGRHFRARHYPTVERHNMVFIWMGDIDRVDESLIPDFHQADHPDWAHVKGYLHIKGNYQLMIDNILDLTHVVFVHKTTLAGGGVTETPLEVSVENDVVRAQRHMYNVDTAPIYKAARNLHDKIDRWQLFEFRAPMYCWVTLGARAAGADEPFGKPTHIVLNAFTPETDTTCHYFWFTVRDWALDDPVIQATYQRMIDLAFREDAAIVEQQQALIDSDTSGAPMVSLAFDRAGVAARRIIRRKLEEEANERRVAAE